MGLVIIGHRSSKSTVGVNNRIIMMKMMLIIMIMMQKRVLRVWSTGKSILLRDLMIILLIIMLILKVMMIITLIIVIMKIGTAPQLATCAAGTVFNPKTSRCDPPIHNLECISLTSQTSSTSPRLQDLTRQSRARGGRSSRRMRKRGGRRKRKSTFRRSRRMSRHCRWPHYKIQTPS